jgi:hypothetical protein
LECFLEGCKPDGFAVLTMQVKALKMAVEKSIQTAHQGGFPLPNNLMLQFPLIADSLKI